MLGSMSASEDFEQSNHPMLPQQAELQELFQARVVVYQDGNEVKPGGQCRCCGCGPNPNPDYQLEPRYIYQANLCDSDGVFYSQACEDCLEDLRLENTQRPSTTRDEQARIIAELLGDDVDGAQSMMDDFEGLDFDLD